MTENQKKHFTKSQRAAADMSKQIRSENSIGDALNTGVALYNGLQGENKNTEHNKNINTELVIERSDISRQPSVSEKANARHLSFSHPGPMERSSRKCLAAVCVIAGLRWTASSVCLQEQSAVGVRSGSRWEKSF